MSIHPFDKEQRLRILKYAGNGVWSVIRWCKNKDLSDYVLGDNERVEAWDRHGKEWKHIGMERIFR